MVMTSSPPPALAGNTPAAAANALAAAAINPNDGNPAPSANKPPGSNKERKVHECDFKCPPHCCKRFDN